MRRLAETSDRAITARLRAWLRVATDRQWADGLAWYPAAQLIAAAIAARVGISRHAAANVIAALSPRNRWERNIEDAQNLAAAWAAGEPEESVTVCTPHANRRKAWAALHGEPISDSAPKSHAFALNISRLDPARVTIDCWAMRSALVPPGELARLPAPPACQESPTEVQYRRLERLHLEAAEREGLAGFELQAIVWTAIREAWK
tara:strand:- start:360 stop:974 length:615 start_codon:yes stop_codon:yes gene_type:complete